MVGVPVSGPSTSVLCSTIELGRERGFGGRGGWKSVLLGGGMGEESRRVEEVDGAGVVKATGAE